MKLRPMDETSLALPALSSLDKESRVLYIKLLIEKQKQDHELRMAEIQLELSSRKNRLGEIMKSTVLEYSKLNKENRYTPNAVTGIASAFASMTGGGSFKIPDLNLQSFEEEKPQKVENTSNLNSRIEKARSQGLRWNDHDVMPVNPETLQRKLREWEEAFNSGYGSEVTHKSYESLLQDTSKAFITGLCVSVEEKYGYAEPISPYLKRRYMKLRDMALKGQGVKVVNTTVAEVPPPEKKNSLDPDAVAEGMYEALYAGVSIDIHHDNVTSVWKRVASEKYGGDFRQIPGYTLAKSATLGGIPTTIIWDSESEKEQTIYRRRFTSEQREKYADQFKAIVDRYLDSIDY
jgi:hypothetical protein